MYEFPRGNAKVFFIVPHADDLEFGPACACIEALNAGNDVTEVLMTNSAYGTTRPEFKGARIHKMRMRELDKTLDVYEKHTGTALKLIKMGYFDGYLQVSREAIDRMKDLLIKEAPDVVFIPDPWFSVDYHLDHINTGRIPLFAMDEMAPTQRPSKIFLYYTFQANQEIKITFSNVYVQVDALKQHKSQIPAKKCEWLRRMKVIQITLNKLKYRTSCERYREVDPANIPSHGSPRFTTIKQSLLHAIFYKLMHPLPRSYYIPVPEETGID
ncbi:MAG: PIG-L deacetylase family protein [Promethearchaeota archaeon]